MTLPKNEELLFHFLSFMQNGAEQNLHGIHQYLCEKFNLSINEIEERLPSGNETKLKNRIRWTKLHLKSAGLIEDTGQRTFVITERGKSFLNERPNGFTNKDLEQFEEYKTFRKKTKLKHKSVRENIYDYNNKLSSVKQLLNYQKLDYLSKLFYEEKEKLDELEISMILVKGYNKKNLDSLTFYIIGTYEKSIGYHVIQNICELLSEFVLENLILPICKIAPQVLFEGRYPNEIKKGVILFDREGDLQGLS
ncbi:winged helix-turn-helix domain-containing protein [Peribacillus butanolivorans]|uniref:winged helix-turn-helix domain-containing protein n=1 Tax=Peribacillus butanolivorans TaxID=421767 RepID=UPI0039FDD3B1